MQYKFFYVIRAKRPSFKFAFLIMAAGIALLAPSVGTFASTNQTTVAVLDFAQMQTGKDQKPHRWLSKALSDLLIGDLGAHRGLRLVTRENMRMLMQEADLREMSGLTEDRLDPDEYRKMQQYMKVDQLILGTFSIKDGEINIQARIICHEAGDILAGFSQVGALTNALNLEKALARSMLQFYSNGEIPADAWELPKWTDSMEASELLYDGVDAFDAGQYNHAWYCFRRAARVDPDYADAHYWIGRMHYYRQDYTHAHTAYRRFVSRFPEHARVGDAVTEYVHSLECGALHPSQVFKYNLPESAEAYSFDHREITPREALELYQRLRQHDWSNVFVHNKVNYASRSPLADWLMKREQQALTYLGRLPEAFALLEEGLNTMPDDPADAGARSWRAESRQLMSLIAMESEDADGLRLTSEFLNSTDYQLTLDNPVAEEDLRGSRLNGARASWGTNWRILAPPGYWVRKVHTEIFRRNDPEVGSICRLQIRRYRYVDIDGCNTHGRGPNEGKKYEKTVVMPYGITWFYLRPEYNGRNGAEGGSFDGWRLTAELEPIASDAGGLVVEVENAFDYNVYINDVYTRCYNGVIRNLTPGTYKLRIGAMWRRIPWAFNDLEREIEIRPDEIKHLPLSLTLKDEVREASWNDPVAIATRYPTYKHRPRPDSNWLSGPPAICIHPETGHYLAVWSHLDNLWYSRSVDGLQWDEPETLPAPVNSADAEVNPRIIIDNQGRYCLLFLSNRGMFRNLATYVSWSRNLQHWSRPIMLNPQHHDDHDIMQDSTGQYILLLTPSDKAPDQEEEQNAVITLQTSRDLVEWSAPVISDSWKQILLPPEQDPDEEKRSASYVPPHKSRIVQDKYGVYHIILSKKSRKRVHHISSSDLKEWTKLDTIDCELRLSPYNIAVTATDERLIVAMIISDGWYSGNEMFTMYSLPLSADHGRMMWRTLAIPPIVISGMPGITYDRIRGKIAVAWQMAEQQLHPTRSSGPVYAMSGDPALRPVQPLTFRSFHVKTGALLDKMMAKMADGNALTEADMALVNKSWDEYNVQMRKIGKDKPPPRKSAVIEDPDIVAYYLNACKMAVIDPANHGGWPMRHYGARRMFRILQNQTDDPNCATALLAAFICPALMNHRPDEAILAYKRLKSINTFWAECILKSVRWIAEDPRNYFRNHPETVAAAQTFLMELNK